jgi:PTH1 family peptidyl-tRNA hydrolase
VGFRVADALAEKCAVTFTEGRGEYYFAEGTVEGTPVVILKPTTFMNDSGVAVIQALERHGVELPNALIVYDDLHLPLGSLRMRKQGSDGGHNGIGSVIYQLQTEEIPRLRCGVNGKQEPIGGKEYIDYVLSDFLSSEEPAVSAMVSQAVQACIAFATAGIDSASTWFNSIADSSI